MDLAGINDGQCCMVAGTCSDSFGMHTVGLVAVVVLQHSSAHRHGVAMLAVTEVGKGVCMS